MFPFANPPYAARAYSYLSVAQYDALKAAWHYKYQYNRPAPANVDDAILQIKEPYNPSTGFATDDPFLETDNLPGVTYVQPSTAGHDAFLVDADAQRPIITSFLDEVGRGR